MTIQNSSKARLVLVRRYNVIESEVVEKVYYNCTGAQAMAWFNNYKLRPGYGKSVLVDIGF